MLSPGVSILAGLVGIYGLSVNSNEFWLALLPTVLTAALVVQQLKVRKLYSGAQFPFIGLFIALQAATSSTFTGSFIALIAACAMSVMFLCVQRPDQTQPIFLTYLVCGIGALFCRSYALLAVALFVPLILVHAFSMRGLVAAFLGIITPFMIATGFNLCDLSQLTEVYAGAWRFGFDLPTIVVAALAVLSAMATFLQAYGYPAITRARNMSLLGLTGCALALTFADVNTARDFLPLLNLCTAYNIAHFVASRLFGWIAVVFVWLLSAGLIMFC